MIANDLSYATLLRSVLYTSNQATQKKEVLKGMANWDNVKGESPKSPLKKGIKSIKARNKQDTTKTGHARLFS